MTYRRVVGERVWLGGGKFAYHQAFTFDIRTDLFVEFVAQFRIRLHITDCAGKALPTATANARRKLLTRTWYNEEWLARHLALASFLSDGRDIIEAGGTGTLTLTSSLLKLTAPSGINEEAIQKGTPMFRSRNPEGTDG